jgi:PAS domain S-box-containing protein
MADDTERKQAEQVLHIERERLALALTTGQMGVYDLDISNDALWWSPQTYALFGVHPDHFTPTRASVEALVDPADLDAFVQLRTQAIATGRPFAYEFRIRRADGTTPWLGLRGQAAYDVQGRPVRSYGIIMDITERRRVEQILRETDQAKDRFIATLAHELRNPLAPIRNAVDVLRRNDVVDPKTAWCHDVIDRQTRQMTRLLDDLLDVSRISRAKLRLRLEPLRLATIIEQAVEIAQPLIDHGGHELTVEVADPALVLQGDLVRLAQVFSNILINAAKYTPRKGRIAVAARRSDGHAVITVTDTGVGLAAEHQSLIFDLFGQVDSGSGPSQGGQGIGLALGKGLVELHGGTISVHSGGPGLGTRFEVRLPLPQLPLAARTAPAHERAPAGASRQRRVLIADDLPDIADSLAMLLEAIGHDVRVAYDGECALRMAEQWRPDVVLLDLGMPKMAGDEVCRQIRSTDWGREMVLIAQTGWGQHDDRRRTADAGFDHHVVKPVDVEVLIELLGR